MIMPVLIAAVAVVGVLCLLDLLLTFGVIRRLREHTDMLTRQERSADPPPGLSSGDVPAEFSVVTTDGEPLSGAAGLRIVAFFASWCSVCPERVPSFIEYLSNNRIARGSVLAVVVDGDSEPPPYLAELAYVARTCIESADGEVGKAFKVTGFPAFFLLDAENAIAASGYDPSALPAPATA
jgi:thiol-disulfide isomerase/thioredoxin